MPPLHHACVLDLATLGCIGVYFKQALLKVSVTNFAAFAQHHSYNTRLIDLFLSKSNAKLNF